MLAYIEVGYKVNTTFEEGQISYRRMAQRWIHTLILLWSRAMQHWDWRHLHVNPWCITVQRCRHTLVLLWSRAMQFLKREVYLSQHESKSMEYDWHNVSSILTHDACIHWKPCLDITYDMKSSESLNVPLHFHKIHKLRKYLTIDF